MPKRKVWCWKGSWPRSFPMAFCICWDLSTGKRCSRCSAAWLIKLSNKKSMKNEIAKFRKSLLHAIDGLIYAVEHERNFRIELAVAAFVLLLIFVFKVKN